MIRRPYCARSRLAAVLLLALTAAGPLTCATTPALADRGSDGGEGGGGHGGEGGGHGGEGEGGGHGGEGEGGGHGGGDDGGRGGRGDDDGGRESREDRNRDADRAHEAVARGWALSLQDVLPTVRRERLGEILDVDLTRRANGAWLYDFLVLSKDGRYLRVSVDAKRNRVIEVRRR